MKTRTAQRIPGKVEKTTTHKELGSHDSTEEAKKKNEDFYFKGNHGECIYHLVLAKMIEITKNKKVVY